jgi:NADPH2:quinone reductase
MPADSVPSTATVVLATAYGDPDVLELVSEPLREPGAGEVVLEVRAAGINPIDWKLYSGAFGTDPDRLPVRLGYEAAGVVVAAGPDAVGPAGPIAVGDEVIGYRLDGAYATHVVAPAEALVPKPASLTWEQAGGLMLAGATAEHALVAAGVGEGDTVLIHGASGGVGLFAVQLAVLRGARVIATASAARHDDLRALGAEPVTYGEGLADRVRALAQDGVDAALDLVGTDEAVDVSLEVVGDRDRIVTIAAFGRGAQDGIKLIGGGPGADPGTEIRAAARQKLAALAADGRLRITATGVPLADVADAHREGQAGHTRGKVSLVP